MYQPAVAEKMAWKDEFGQWIVIGLYLGLLLSILLLSKFLRARSANKEESPILEHFFAGRSLGPAVLGFSVFASMFSGYTVVALPAEAYDKGFSAWRWVGSSTMVALVYIAYGPRLHWLARERNYDSVFSFIWDRYGMANPIKNVLHWLLMIVILFPCFVYLVAQFDAFSNTLSSLSGGALSKPLGCCILGVILVIFEIFGGLRAVAFTDLIQGGVLILGAMLILVFVNVKPYAGISRVSELLERQEPKHVQVMSSDAALSWAEFWIGIGFQRALFPDYMVRVMSADSQRSLRLANVILAIAPFVVQAPLALYGLTGRAYHPDLDNSKAVFSTVVLDIYNGSAGGAIFGSIMMAATIAGIMSTADSVLISVSHIVSLDLVRPFLVSNVHENRSDAEKKPEEETQLLNNKLMRISRVTTFVTALVAIAIAIPLVETNQNLSFLIKFQSTFLANCTPLFILGLYWRQLGRISVFVGLLFGLCIGIPLVGEPRPDAPPGQKGAILISLACNFAAVFITHGIMRAVGKGELDYGPQSETHDRLLKLISWRPPSYPVCEGVPLKLTPCEREPIWKNWWVMLLVFVLSWFALPFYRKAGEIDSLILGSPAWAFLSIMILVVVHAILIAGLFINWRGENDESAGEVKL
jgi:Na+/proline symporter